MLPRSRNRTYTTATPVNPQDLNDLQDADIITPVVFPPCAFVLRSGTAALDANTWTVTAASTFYAPLALPVGRTIIETKIGYNRGNGAVSLKIVKVNTATGTPPVTTDVLDEAVLAGYQLGTTTVAITIEAGFAYYIYVSLNGTTGSLYSVSIE